MLTIFLVITQVSAEWVEISQQHYRKPIRIHSIHDPFTRTDKTEIEDTTNSRTHKVNSIADYNWTTATESQGYTTNSELRQSPSSDEREIMNKEYHLDKEDDKLELKVPRGLSKLSTESSDIDKLKATIERVPSKGNVKRVQLKNNPVKSPVINKKNEKDPVNNRYEEYPLYNAEDTSEDKKKILIKNNNRRIYLNQLNTELTSTFPMIEDSKYKDSPTQQYKNHTVLENMLLATPTFVSATEQLTRFDELDEFSKISRNNLFTTENPNLYDEVVTKHSITIRKQTNDYNHENNSNNIKDRMTVVGNQTISKFISAKSNTNPNEVNNIPKTNKDNNSATSVGESNIENKIQNLNKEKLRKEDNQKTNEINPQSKVNNMDNLLKLLKAVTATISQNTRRSFGGKTKYLHELKNSILANIAERIDATWPDDVTTRPRRTSRSMRMSPRGQHLYFPSSESALMTISFLTFAVFLIKLVLQLMQTYKNKAMMVAPVMVASASRAART